MRSQIKLGRIAGIEIGLHYSWFLIAILIAFSLATHFQQVRPDWGNNVAWAAAVITAVLFFITLLLHELAHSLVAKSRGLRVRAITLFALGGVSQIESESPNASSEFWIAIVGPLTSLCIGAILIGAAHLSGWQAGQPANAAGTVLLWLGYINIWLAMFNMIPGFPLDGGRILRAIIWWITGNADRSTQIAARIGQVVAFLFILYGVYRFFLRRDSGGLWIAFIGWFLLDAARASYAQTGLVENLRNRRVADIMESNCVQVEAYLSVRDFVDQYLLHSGSRCYVVMQNNQPAGLITPAEINQVSHDNWMQTSLQSIMRPLSSVPAVPPEMPAIQALELMGRQNANQLAVMANGHLQGIFSRWQVSRFLQIHSGLGAGS